MNTQSDTPMERRSILQMRDEEIDALLMQIREHRMKRHRQLEEARQLRAKALAEKYLQQIDKQIALFVKDLEKFDAWVEKLEKRWTNIQALKIQIEAE